MLIKKDKVAQKNAKTNIGKASSQAEKEMGPQFFSAVNLFTFDKHQGAYLIGAGSMSRHFPGGDVGASRSSGA